MCLVGPPTRKWRKKNWDKTTPIHVIIDIVNTTANTQFISLYHLRRYIFLIVSSLCVMSKIQGMDLEITTAAALRGHSRGHSSPKKITALPSNRMVNTSFEIINTSIELIKSSIELINTSIETYVALAFSFMHALNIMFTSPQAIAQSLAIML